MGLVFCSVATAGACTVIVVSTAATIGATQIAEGTVTGDGGMVASGVLNIAGAGGSAAGGSATQKLAPFFQYADDGVKSAEHLVKTGSALQTGFSITLDFALNEGEW